MNNFRRAFTMIELIMVIVILGIVGMIVTEVLAQAYKGAFYQQKYAEREVELERVLSIIEKRLKDALVDSIVLLDGAPACQAIANQDIANDYTVAFIAVDRDSMNGLWDGNRSKNGWSEQGSVGLVTGVTVLDSLDANFNVSQNIIPEVYPGKTIADAAVYRYPLISNVCTDFGWTGATSNALSTVAYSSPTRLQISGAPGLNSQQTYRFAASAYAFKRIPGATVSGDGTLMMYSNFQPWLTETYSNGDPSVVAENVSHFAIRLDSGSAHSISGNPSLTGAFYRINVCMKVVSDTDDTINTAQDQICKEKSVYVR